MSKIKIIEGTQASDNVSVASSSLFYGLSGDDRISSRVSETQYIDNRYWSIPSILSGGLGDDNYDIAYYGFSVVADGFGGFDRIEVPRYLYETNEIFLVDGRHLYLFFGSDQSTSLLVVDALRKESQIERVDFLDAYVETSVNELPALLEGVGYQSVSWDQALKSGMFNLRTLGYENSIDGVNELIDLAYSGGNGVSQGVHRFFNASKGTHFYTDSQSEANSVRSRLPEYQYEGVAYQAPSSGGTQLYRFFNAGKGYHFMTASSAEADVITGNPEWGYQYEGRSFNVSATETAATPTEVYRFYKPSQGVHFYSASVDEANNVIANSIGGGYNLDNALGQDNLLSNGWGYVYEGIAWYAS